MPFFPVARQRRHLPPHNLPQALIAAVRHYDRALLVDYYVLWVPEARGRALAVGITSFPVARHRAHRPIHRHPPHRVVAPVRHQNAPVHVDRQAHGVVEARGGALSVDKAFLPVAGERTHGAAGRDDPDGVVAEVRHDVFAVGRHRHAVRIFESRSRALPVCEALLPVAREGADRAGLGYEAQGVVATVHHHHVVCMVHCDTRSTTEARGGTLAVFVFVLIFLPCEDNIGNLNL